MEWYRLDVEDVLKEANVSKEGLDEKEVLKRFSEHGPNKIVQKKKKTAFAIFLGQFTDVMILVLIAAAVISGFIGELSDTIAIVVIVVLNAIIGFVQEYRAERAMEALKSMAAPSSLVKRNGRIREIPAHEVVPGDLVILEAGRIVPADLRMIELEQLKTQEAAITGESLPVDKTTGPIDKEDVPLGDRINVAYKGTTVAFGRGTGVVTSTGMKTELGKIATMIQGEKEVKTPLQKRLAAFGTRLAIAVLVICIIFFIVGLLRGAPSQYNPLEQGPYWIRILLTAISLAVAAIPEALPAVVTISLALGARKLVQQNALIRKLPAVETLGSVTYICSDKTGTLTMNKMSLEMMYLDGMLHKVTEIDPPKKQENTDTTLHHLLTSLAISIDASRDEHGKGIGDPTEIAL